MFRVLRVVLGWFHRLLRCYSKLIYLAKKPFMRKKVSSRFLPVWQQWRFLSGANFGLLLDGTGRRRLSADHSFEHVAVLSPTGAGKTTRYIVPNILTLDHCSMVITDPSGEIFEQTSGYLQRRGFLIQVLNLADPSRGFGYNPVAKADSFTDLDKLAEVLMRSANPVVRPGDDIWYTGPQSLMAVLLRCLKNSGRPEWQNLHNLLHLLQHFGKDGKALLDFVAAYHGDQATLNQFQEFCAGNEKMIASFLTMATNALRLLNNPDIARMMARDELDFHALRERKTVVYLIVPETDARFYRFIINTFYSQFFASQKQLRYKQEGFPIYCLLDEFGQFYVPDFPTIATTIRKYRVSLSIIIQDVGQLREQYGQNGAATILSGAMRTKLFYSGLDVETAKMVETMLGRVRVPYHMGQSNDLRHQEENLLNADRISRIPDSQAILIRGNEEPVWFWTLPFYRNRSLKARTEIEPVNLPNVARPSAPEYLPLLSQDSSLPQAVRNQPFSDIRKATNSGVNREARGAEPL